MKKLIFIYCGIIIILFLLSGLNKNTYVEYSYILKSNYSYLTENIYKINIYLFSNSSSPYFSNTTEATYYISDNYSDLCSLELKEVETYKEYDMYTFKFIFNSVSLPINTNEAYFTCYVGDNKYKGLLGNFVIDSEYHNAKELNISKLDYTYKNGFIKEIILSINDLSNISNIYIPGIVYKYEYENNMLKIILDSDETISNVFIIINDDQNTYKISRFFIGSNDFSFKTNKKNLGAFLYDRT